MQRAAGRKAVSASAELHRDTAHIRSALAAQADANGACTVIPEEVPEVMPEGADASAILNGNETGAAVQSAAGPAGE